MAPSLRTYRKKRDFERTAEPPGKVVPGKEREGGRFVLHEHHASSLHFDLRLEMGGVLKSWAVPKGPSLDPRERRLAVETEDHPIQYLTFRGSIADGQYGAGEMRIWDTGRYRLTKGGDALEAWRQGRLHIDLEGDKVHGSFMLVRSGRSDRQWLFFKLRDEAAVADWTPSLILPYGPHREKPADLDALEAAVPPPKPLPAMKRAKTEAAAKAKAKAKSSAAPPEGTRSGASVVKPPKKGKLPARKWPAGSRPASLPAFVPPMLATLADEPFDDPLWVFETKWDGWRAQLRYDGKKTGLTSRAAKSLDAMFPELASVGDWLKAGACLLDGEVVALDDQGQPRFQLLQNRLKGRKAGDEGGHMVYYAFDLLHLEGRDLTGCSLLERKALLKRILPAGGPLRFSEHFPERGEEVFRQASNLGFEGVIAKRAGGTYVQGRSADWLKIKTRKRQEVVIAGMTEPRGSRAHFGSLVAGLYDKGELAFAGHVGGGFNAKLLAEVHGLLAKHRTKACPFKAIPKTNEKVEWLRPKAVAEVEFAEWTDDGRMRQPIFMGLRPDKDPKDCVREVEGETGKLVREAESHASAPGPAKLKGGKRAPAIPAASAAPAEKADRAGRTDRIHRTEGAPSRSEGWPEFTNLQKVYWPGEGRTKGDLIAYYDAVSPWLLPHLKDRPLILKRFPDGIERPPFFQHDIKHPPPRLKTVVVPEDDGTEVRYALCQDRESLLWLANLGVIPLHPWLSRVPNLGRPDHIVFDLDPGEVPFEEVVRMALFLGGLLESLGLTAFPKTSGSKGIHVYVPLKPAYTFTQGLGFAQLVAEWAVGQAPESFTVERSLKLRKKDRIYLDCMQNSEGKSVAAVYSARERPGGTVSAPLLWSELKRGVRREDFTMESMPVRLKKKGDLFAEVLKVKNPLEGPLKKLERLLKEREVPA